MACCLLQLCSPCTVTWLSLVSSDDWRGDWLLGPALTGGTGDSPLHEEGSFAGVFMPQHHLWVNLKISPCRVGGERNYWHGVLPLIVGGNEREILRRGVTQFVRGIHWLLFSYQTCKLDIFTAGLNTVSKVSYCAKFTSSVISLQQTC